MRLEDPWLVDELEIFIGCRYPWAVDELEVIIGCEDVYADELGPSVDCEGA